MLSPKQAISKIETTFPEISSAIHHDIIEGLLHPQIGVLSHLVQSHIDTGNEVEFRKACDLFTDLFSGSEPSVINALNVSFLEHLNFADGEKKRSWAYSKMPQSMKSAFDSMTAYNDSLHGRA